MNPKSFRIGISLTLLRTILLVILVSAGDDQNNVINNLTKKNLLQGRADVVFLLDRSGSVGSTNFEIMKGFVESLLTHVVVDANATRIAVISYSNTAEIHINYIRNPKTKCFLSQELQDVIYRDSAATNIAAAFNEARNVLADSRPNVNKVAILISDGLSNYGNDPIPVADLLKKEISGIQIFAFGIGRFLKMELQALASSPDHVYSCSEFKDFKRLARKIRGDPHESIWSDQTTVPSCDHLCESPYKGEANDPGCCDHHARCSCALLSGMHTCVCQPGYFGLKGTWGDCRACPRGTYKSRLEPTPRCTECPTGSTTAEEGSTSIRDCYCKDGYIGNPSEKTACTVVKCPPLQRPANGILLGTCNNNFQSQCHFMCDEGYEFRERNNDILTCGANGQWSGSLPFCRKIQCHPPITSRLVEMKCDPGELNVGKKCYFRCYSGHILNGSKERECLPNKDWSGKAVECIALQCPVPKPLRHGKIYNCPANFKPDYHQTCIFHCNHGFELVGPSIYICDKFQSLTNPETGLHHTAGIPYCNDVTRPEITCPSPVSVAATKGRNFAYVSWSLPNAVDNAGDVPRVETSPPGIRSPAKFFIGATNVAYKATDSSGLTEFCEFTVTVKDIEPPQVLRCPQTIQINTTDTLTDVHWKEPVFKDNSQKPVTITKSDEPGDIFEVGSHNVVYIARDESGNRATCQFEVIVAQTYCPYYPPPVNGAFACEDWMYGQFCQAYCNEKYDYVTRPAEWYICTLDAKWETLPAGHPIPWPDCTRRVLPNHVRQMLLGYYYSGNCNDPRVQEAIRLAFLTHFRSTFSLEYCSTEGACTLEMVKVSCGDENQAVGHKYITPFSRSRRGISQKKKLEIELDFVLHQDEKIEITEEFIQEFANYIENLNWNIDDELKKQLSPDDLVDANNLISPLSVTSKKTEILCQPGSIRENRECMMCPLGCYHNQTMDKCIECPIGYYQSSEGQTSCQPCPLHTSTENAHSRNEIDCKGICGEGTFSMSGLETCIACPLGTFNNFSQQVQCLPCPNGTTTASESSTSIEDCQRICKPGTFSDTGIEPCTPCSLGYYQPLHSQTMCIECSDNFTTKEIGSSSFADCVDYNPCYGNTLCRNGGTCFLYNHNTACNCTLEYGGTFCEEDTDECLENSPCMNGGKCLNTDGSFICNCTAGFQGSICENVISACDSSPCLNNGTCVNKKESYLCICGPRFEGGNCEKELGLCFGNIICKNGGTCVIQNRTRLQRCACLDGFTGADCSVNINDCYNITCQNNGSCVDDLAGFHCSCTEGFSGVFCETEIDECKNNLCNEGSTCVDKVGGYQCLCLPGWNGEFCRHKMSSNYIMLFPENSSLANMATAKLQFPLTEVTVAMWVQTNADHGDKCGTPLSYAALAAGTDNNSENEIVDNALAVCDCSDITVYINNEPAVTEILVADGKWHHFAFTWSSKKGEWKAYKDGELRANGTGLQANTQIPGGGSLVIGQEQDDLAGGFSSLQMFTGNITRLNIWNSSFSSENISSLYQLDDDMPGKVVAWPDFVPGVTGDISILENERPPLVHEYVTINN